MAAFRTVRRAALLGVFMATLLSIPNQLASGTREALLFFDGICNLCDGFVNVVADYDPNGRVRFGAIQRHGELMASYGAGRYAEGGAEALSTLVLVQDGEVYVRSEAALRVVALLEPPLKYLAAFYVLPRPVRDWGYKLVAKYRYHIFGQTETCRPPTPRFQQRFLDYVGPPADAMPWVTPDTPTDTGFTARAPEIPAS